MDTAGDYVVFSSTHTARSLELKDYSHDWYNDGLYFDAKKLKSGEIISIGQQSDAQGRGVVINYFDS